MKDVLAANRYAKALLELSLQMKQDELVEAELESFSAALRSSKELEKFLNNPRIQTEEKVKIIERIYPQTKGEVYTLLSRFFALLFEKNRFNLVQDVVTSFKRLADEAQRQALVEIRTAVPLDSARERQMIEKLEKIAGYKLTVTKTVDRTLVGGVVVRFKNKVIDGSVKHKLDSLKKELTKIKLI